MWALGLDVHSAVLIKHQKGKRKARENIHCFYMSIWEKERASRIWERESILSNGTIPRNLYILNLHVSQSICTTVICTKIDEQKTHTLHDFWGINKGIYCSRTVLVLVDRMNFSLRMGMNFKAEGHEFQGSHLFFLLARKLSYQSILSVCTVMSQHTNWGG